MIIWLNCQDNDITFNKKNYLLRAAERMTSVNIFRDIKTRGDEPLDFVLNITPYESCIAGNQWTAVWELDQVCNRSQFGRDWPGVDTVFLTSLAISPEIPVKCEEKHRLLFQACDPHLHDRMSEPSYDFVQCGTAGDGVYAERSRLIRLLQDKGFTFHDFGKHYSPEDYVRNISQAKVQFIRSGSNYYAEGELAQRFFECLAIGPVLTNWVEDLKYTGLVEGEDYMAYRNDEELIQKMKLLIEDEDLRKKIAKSGRQKALLYHSYENRLGAIYNYAIFERKGMPR